MPKKKKILMAVCAAVLLPLLIWTIWSNTTLQLTEFTVQSPEIPEAFDGFRIAQVSDLHNCGLAEKVLTKLRSLQPDIIAITGDLIDSRNTDVAAALDFVEQAVEIAPCYYVTGNHESRVEEYAQLKEELLALGVTVLENECVTLQRDGETIYLLGVLDPTFETDYITSWEAKTMEQSLKPISQVEGFTILLSHRPKFLKLYDQYDMDLVLSGHAHGGQFRLPFLGGVYAPDQGLFPAYDAGLFVEGDTQMVVSRGIGNSIFPLRFNNPPELILVTLGRQDAN
jgi:predicted MPP superfamily phosphohydrolase